MNTQKHLLQKNCNQLTQFELTTRLLTNLSKYKITPTAKLVLLYLSSCYNPLKKDVYPKQKTISVNIGISERSVVRAIAELCNAGLIVIECKFQNRYRFTNKITKNFESEKLSDNNCQNVAKVYDKLSQHEQIKEQNKEPSKNTNKISITDFEKLKQYATSKGAKNPVAYANKIISNGNINKVLADIQEIEKIKNNALLYIETTQEKIKELEKNKTESVAPPLAWIQLKEILQKKRGR